MVTALEAGGVATVKSQGGFFLLAALNGGRPPAPLRQSWEFGMQAGLAHDWAFCLAMAAELGIVALPMSPFFREGSEDRSRFVRFCFAKTVDTLEEATKRLTALSEGG